MPSYHLTTTANPLRTQPHSQSESVHNSGVTKLFLAAGGKDHEVKLKEQTSDSIRFTILAEVEVGSYNLMIQTGGATPTLPEQPLRCTVENEDMARKRAEEAAAFQKQLEEEAQTEEEKQPESEGKP